MPYPVSAARGRPAGPPFSPKDIANLKLWLRADSISGLADGAAVSAWPDSSGVGNNATQATGSKQPVYKAGIVNGKPVVRFAGGDDALDCANPSYAQPLTVLAVVKVNDTGATKTVYGATTATSGVETSLYFPSSEVVSLWGSSVLSGSGSQAGAFKVFSAVVNAASSKLFVNGAQNGSTGNAGPNATGAFRVGNNAPGNAGLDGDLAELLIYNALLSDADRRRVESYLGAKYGIAVT